MELRLDSSPGSSRSKCDRGEAIRSVIVNIEKQKQHNKYQLEFGGITSNNLSVCTHQSEFDLGRLNEAKLEAEVNSAPVASPSCINPAIILGVFS